MRMNGFRRRWKRKTANAKHSNEKPRAKSQIIPNRLVS